MRRPRNGKGTWARQKRIARADPARNEIAREISKLYHKLGRIYERSENYSMALSCYNATINLVNSAMEPHFYGVVMHDIGDVCRKEQKLDEAVSYYQRAREFKAKSGVFEDAPDSLIVTLRALMRIYEEQEKFTELLGVGKEVIELIDAVSQKAD